MRNQAEAARVGKPEGVEISTGSHKPSPVTTEPQCIGSGELQTRLAMAWPGLASLILV